MATSLSLDDRISRLVPEVDPAIRAELRKVLQTLRQVQYHDAVIVMMSSLAMKLFQDIYDAAGHPWPKSDNLYDVIIRAGKGDPDEGVTGYRILPDALDSGLHTLRIFANKIRHNASRYEMDVEEAELVLNAFLILLRWYHCASGLTAKLASIYAVTPSAGAKTDDVRSVLHINRDLSSFTGDEQRHLLTAVSALLGIGPVTLVGVRGGSVYLTVRLRRDLAAELGWAIKAGAFSESHVVGVRIEELEAEKGEIGEGRTVKLPTMVILGAANSGRTFLEGTWYDWIRQGKQAGLTCRAEEGSAHYLEYSQACLSDASYAVRRRGTFTMNLCLRVSGWWRRLWKGPRFDFRLVSPISSGELFQTLDKDRDSWLPHLRGAKALVWTVDANELKRHDYREMKALSGVIADLRHAGPYAVRAPLNKPLAVVLTKCDLTELLRPDSPLLRLGTQGTEYNPRLGQEVSRLVEAYLHQRGMGGLVALARDNFRQVAFFAVSVIGPAERGEEGTALSARTIRPYRVEEPLLWVLHQWGYL